MGGPVLIDSGVNSTLGDSGVYKEEMCFLKRLSQSPDKVRKGGVYSKSQALSSEIWTWSISRWRQKVYVGEAAFKKENKRANKKGRSFEAS